MTEIPENIYSKSFDKIFDWFHYNVHAGPDEFDYEIIDLNGTHLKMVDIVRKSTNGLYFRVILKATYEVVDHSKIPPKNYKDLAYFNTKTKNEIIPATAVQVCYVQMSPENIPIHGILYTYSAHDEKYHEFKLEK